MLKVVAGSKSQSMFLYNFVSNFLINSSEYQSNFSYIQSLVFPMLSERLTQLSRNSSIIDIPPVGDTFNKLIIKTPSHFNPESIYIICLYTWPLCSLHLGSKHDDSDTPQPDPTSLFEIGNSSLDTTMAPSDDSDGLSGEIWWQ